MSSFLRFYLTKPMRSGIIVATVLGKPTDGADYAEPIKLGVRLGTLVFAKALSVEFGAVHWALKLQGLFLRNVKKLLDKGRIKC